MSERSFIDTNILIYTDDGDNPDKQSIALELLERLRRSGLGVISTQVMMEYFAAATKKLSVDVETARRKLELFSRMDVVQLSPADILAAIDLHRLYHLSPWDALILHAAKIANCPVLYSEDMAHGSKIAGVKIVNPFK